MGLMTPSDHRFSSEQYEEANALVGDWGREGPTRCQQLLAGALIEIGKLRQEAPIFPPPESGTFHLCLLCARKRPWSLWGPGGVTVCKVCHAGAHLAETMLLHDRLWMDTRGATLEAVRASLAAYENTIAAADKDDSP